MSIYIVRHSYTEMNMKKIIQGHADSPLTNEGIEMANKLGKYLKNKEIRKIFTSSLGRCVQTSEIINKHLNVTIEKKDELMEQNYGIHNGKLRMDVKEVFNEFDENEVPEGGESLVSAQERAKKFLKELNEDKVVIVTHTGIMHGFDENTTPLTILELDENLKVINREEAI